MRDERALVGALIVITDLLDELEVELVLQCGVYEDRHVVQCSFVGFEFVFDLGVNRALNVASSLHHNLIGFCENRKAHAPTLMKSLEETCIDRLQCRDYPRHPVVQLEDFVQIHVHIVWLRIEDFLEHVLELSSTFWYHLFHFCARSFHFYA